MLEKFTGSGAALITPFTRDLEIDYDGLQKLLDHVNKYKVDYLVINGTTGESATTTPKEKAAILDYIREHNVRNLPLVFGVGGYNTMALLESFKNFNFDQVDAILSVSPYYNKPTQNGIINHFQILADHAPSPIIMYNIPGRSVVNMHPETILKLAEHPNIIGVKEATGNWDQVLEIARNKDADFGLISGDDLFTLPLITIGGIGSISVMANLFPAIFNRMIHAALAGKMDEARAMILKMVDINPLMYEESNPVGLKQALTELGICQNYVRPPLLPATEGLRQKISNAVKMVLKEIN